MPPMLAECAAIESEKVILRLAKKRCKRETV